MLIIIIKFLKNIIAIKKIYRFDLECKIKNYKNLNRGHV